ncbi:hypothetical protein GJ744_001272 [Endocarpon pusillum]|uniref:Uncharacterized protein n=1 Tax=Endocarpon pusillum TaxID=364733 RepID=A0A8H7A9L7_9EURO|nr:hypothetical protein GJ744_001272 [Endocarpon pusillum]
MQVVILVLDFEIADGLYDIPVVISRTDMSLVSYAIVAIAWSHEPHKTKLEGLKG